MLRFQVFDQSVSPYDGMYGGVAKGTPSIQWPIAHNLIHFVFNSSPAGQNGLYFADDIFKCIS